MIGRGTFFEPTLIVNVHHQMELMTEENFGPILSVMKVRDDTEAFQKIDDSHYGLTAAIYTTSQERAEAMRQMQNILSVESAVEEHDPSLLTDLLLRHDVQQALESTSAHASLPAILADALDNGQQAMFLQYAASSADRWLLLSFHPSTRQYAGILSIPSDADRESVGLGRRGESPRG